MAGRAVLVSFGIDRRLSPFRAFVAEPLVRTSGSLELFVSPEYLALDEPLSRRFGFRVGVRAHFPIIEKGDYLSVSLGTAYVRFGESESASYQFGAYLLFGFLGFEQSIVPALDEARWIGDLQREVLLKSRVAWIVAVAVAAAGCRAATFLPRFLVRTVELGFQDIRKVEPKLKDPVRPDAELAVLWVGHATVLIQIADKFVLTDPVFTDTVGQVSKRLVEPGLDAENLPALDLVLVSHMHFDHLSLGSLERIEPKVRDLVVPQRGSFIFPVLRFAPGSSPRGKAGNATDCA